MRKVLQESLFPGDLKDLVKPIISIDEFESKIDPKAVVLAFYVREEDPAYDLSRFLEFGPLECLLDTEVSPAPDINGDYLVFLEVEYKDSKHLAEIIKNLLGLVRYLTGVELWKYSFRGKHGRITTSKRKSQ